MIIQVVSVAFIATIIFYQIHNQKYRTFKSKFCNEYQEIKMQPKLNIVQINYFKKLMYHLIFYLFQNEIGIIHISVGHDHCIVGSITKINLGLVGYRMSRNQ